MFLYYLGLVCVSALIATFFVTQLVFPLLRGTTMFPAFRKTRQDVVDTFVKTKEQLEVSELELKIAELSRQLAENHKLLASKSTEEADAS